MIPQTVPSRTNFPLFPQPAPVGSPLQALGLGQEVRLVTISSLGNFSLIHLVCTFTSHLRAKKNGLQLGMVALPVIPLWRLKQDCHEVKACLYGIGRSRFEKHG